MLVWKLLVEDVRQLIGRILIEARELHGSVLDHFMREVLPYVNVLGICKATSGPPITWLPHSMHLVIPTPVC